MVVALLVPADPPGRRDDSTAANTVHGVAALTAFPALPVAALVLTATWRPDPRWRRSRSLLTVSAGGTVVAYAALMVALVVVMGGPGLGAGPHPTIVGLLERVMLWSYVGWLVVVAVSLSRAPARPVRQPGRR